MKLVCIQVRLSQMFFCFWIFFKDALSLWIKYLLKEEHNNLLSIVFGWGEQYQFLRTHFQAADGAIDGGHIKEAGIL